MILFSVAVAMIRGGSTRFGLFLIPILLQSGCLSLAALSHEFRFQFPIYMTALIYSGHFLFCVPRWNAGNSGFGRTYYAGQAVLRIPRQTFWVS